MFYCLLNWYHFKYFLDTLGFYTEEHKFNYLAYLLADKNDISIRVAKLHNDDFVERNGYGGCCLIKSINKVLEKLEVENKTAIKITGKAEREQKNLVNSTALREAILNMFCHNDYSQTDPYIIIHDDRFELIACGGLPQGLSKEEFFAGRSLPRNRELMRVMGDLDLGEHMGRGMRRIMKVLKEEDFDISENFLSVNFKFDSRALEMLDEHNKEVEIINTLKLTEQEQTIVNFINEHGSIRRITVEDLLDVKVSRAKEILSSLVDKNVLYIEGNGPSAKYKRK